MAFPMGFPIPEDYRFDRVNLFYEEDTVYALYSSGSGVRVSMKPQYTKPNYFAELHIIYSDISDRIELVCSCYTSSQLARILHKNKEENEITRTIVYLCDRLYDQFEEPITGKFKYRIL